MKKRIWLWSIIATLAMGVNVACSDDENSEPKPTTPEVKPTPSETTPVPTIPILVDTMECNPTVIDNIDYKGATVTFVTTTNKTFYITSPQEWIKVLNPEGRALTEDFSINVAVAENNGEARQGTLYVIFDDKQTTTIEVEVKQKAVEYPEAPVVDYTYSFKFEKTGYWTGIDWSLKDANAVAEKLGVSNLKSAIESGAVVVKAYDVNNVPTSDVKVSHTAATGYWFDANGKVTTQGGDPNPATVCVEFNADYISGQISTLPSNIKFDNTYPGIIAYVCGDKCVNVQVELNVVDKIRFEAPQPNVIYPISAEKNDTYTGTEWDLSSYKNDIAAALEVEDYDAAVSEGIIKYYGFKLDGLYTNGPTSNTGYWVNDEGIVVNWNNNSYTATEGLSSNYLSGHVSQMPGMTMIGSTYPNYMVLYNTSNDKMFVVKFEITITEVEVKPIIQWDIVKEFNYTFDISLAKGYEQTEESYSTYDITADAATFADLLGASVDNTVLMKFINDEGETDYQSWSITDGWFGNEGAVYWGSESIACIKPNSNGTFGFVGCKNDVAEVGDKPVGEFLFANKASNKAVKVNITANIIE